MSGQINVRLSPEDYAEFERWASDVGLERGALGKKAILEGLMARREGRASFEWPETLGPGDMIAMKAMMDRGLMEINRIATAWAKHEGEMRRQERDDQNALTQARAEFIAGIPERISTSLNPIREEMDAMIERIDKQPRLDEIDARQTEHTAALKANTAAIEQLAKEPRTQNMYDLGLGHWNGKAWSIVLGVFWTLSVGLFFALALILPSGVLAVRTANLLLGGGDQAICALVDYRHSTDTCKTRVNGRQVGVTLNVPAPKRERR